MDPTSRPPPAPAAALLVAARAHVAVALAVAGCVAARAAPSGAAPVEHVTRVEHQADRVSPSLGPRDAPVQIELFFVPGPSSRQPYQLIRELWRRHPTRIRVTFRVLSRKGPVYLPTAVLEAGAQGKFEPFMSAVNSRLRSGDPQDMVALARDVGMDVERLSAAWRDGRHASTLESNDLRRQRLRVQQLPDAVFAGKPAARPLSVLGASDLETAFQEAYGRARDLLDRGHALAQVPGLLEERALATRSTGAVILGPSDERVEELDPADTAFALLARPIDLHGLPTAPSRVSAPRPPPRWLPPEAPAPRRQTPIVVACNPLSVHCPRQLQLASISAGAFEGGVRVVWAPMFDLRSPDAAIVAQVSDALLCAQTMGFGTTALDRVLSQTESRSGRVSPAAQLIDGLIAAADLDREAMASCLAVTAGASVRRTVALRRAGMALSPTVVIGGRMYPGGMSDTASVLQIVESERARGWLGELSVAPVDGNVDP